MHPANRALISLASVCSTPSSQSAMEMPVHERKDAGEAMGYREAAPNVEALQDADDRRAFELALRTRAHGLRYLAAVVVVGALLALAFSGLYYCLRPESARIFLPPKGAKRCNPPTPFPCAQSEGCFYVVRWQAGERRSERPGYCTQECDIHAGDSCPRGLKCEEVRNNGCSGECGTVSYFCLGAERKRP